MNNNKQYTVAIVGATGVVGKELIQTLEQRDFPVEKLVLLASSRSAGTIIFFKEESIPIEELKETSFKGVDIALFSAGGSISEQYAPHAVDAGAVVIDNTSHFRLDEGVPLVVPEVNAHAITRHQGIIANPNCSTAQLVVPLKPLHDKGKLKRLVISTYQAVSGAGKDAILELENQSRLGLCGGELKPEVFSYPIAFNIIPQIDVFQENGYTKEEMKMVLETQKILEADIAITATTVRVPVFIGHSESVNVETDVPISVNDARALIDGFPGVQVLDDPSKSVYPTPRELAGTDDVYVGRIRKDISNPNAIELWIVADNLRKGAALNTIQIAESLIK
jgi:aspartate-semialdehyde dehydrogenase